MHAFPECLDLFDDTETVNPITVLVTGLSLSDFGTLPRFGDRLLWQLGDPGTQTPFEQSFHFVFWRDDLVGPLAAQMASSDYRAVVMIFHRPDQAPPPASIRPYVHVCYDGEPLDALLRLVAPLLMPLLFTSVVCVAIEDYEFLFARGGHLKCLAQTRNRDLSVCMTDLVWQLSEARKPVGGFNQMMVSMLLPSSLPPMSVFDRVVGSVRQANTAEDPDLLISTLVHGEVTSRICVFALEAFQA